MRKHLSRENEESNPCAVPTRETGRPRQRRAYLYVTRAGSGRGSARRTGRSRRGANPARRSSRSSATSAPIAAAAASSAAISRGARAVAGTQTSVCGRATAAAAGATADTDIAVAIGRCWGLVETEENRGRGVGGLAGDSRIRVQSPATAESY
jgi:hypothetical protein